jgi:S1-C subfamily serine protease
VIRRSFPMTNRCATHDCRSGRRSHQAPGRGQHSGRRVVPWLALLLVTASCTTSPVELAQRCVNRRSTASKQLEACKQAIKVLPDTSPLLLPVARVFAFALDSARSPEALSAYTLLVRTDSNNQFAKVRRAELLADSGSDAEAVEQARSVVNGSADWRLLARVGLLLRRVDSLALCAKAFLRADSLAPSRDSLPGEMLLQYARLLSDFGFYANAVDFAERAARKLPRSSRAMSEHARALQFSGSGQQALSVLLSAPRLLQDSAGFQAVLADVQLGRGRYEEAVRAYRRGIELDPDAFPRGYYNLGRALIYLIRPEEAQAALREGAKRLPSRADIWGLLAYATWYRRDYAGAVAAWERALREDPGYFETQRGDRALWQQSIRLAGDQPPTSLAGESFGPGLRSTASAFFVNEDGLLLTNNHAVAGCDSVTVRTNDGENLRARVRAVDAANDLALLAVEYRPRGTVPLRLAPPIRAGETVVAVGFPLEGVLSSEAKVTSGAVNSLAGIHNDSRLFQVSAPVQPGNSGGPLLDVFGNIIGVVVARLDAIELLRQTGELPENVNFAIKSSVAQTFLEANDVRVSTHTSSSRRDQTEIAAMGTRIAALIRCYGGTRTTR